MPIPFRGARPKTDLSVENAWKTIVGNAIINNPYEISGTGPLLFGGFSFDPYSIKDNSWGPFGHSLFHLPKYMLTKNKGEYYMTVNLICSPESRASDFEEAEHFSNWLLEKNQETLLSIPPVILKQEEIMEKEWIKSVEKIVAELNGSELQKVVLARKMKLEFAEMISSDYILQKLTTQQQNSFTFALEVGESCFLGASPERLVKIIGNEVLSACLAGSLGRSADPVLDEQLGETLLQDPKNRFEHDLVVTMVNEALQPYCDELNIPQEPKLMKMPDIQHLFTPVSGKIKQGGSIFRIIEDLHPTPALGGVPTKAAMQIIRENEAMDRGFYAAPLGWTDYRGNGEFIVAIRSGLVQGKEAYLYAGCGLVTDSDPEEELIETRMKFRPMLRAMEGESK